MNISTLDCYHRVTSRNIITLRAFYFISSKPLPSFYLFNFLFPDERTLIKSLIIKYNNNNISWWNEFVYAYVDKLTCKWFVHTVFSKLRSFLTVMFILLKPLSCYRHTFFIINCSGKVCCYFSTAEGTSRDSCVCRGELTLPRSSVSCIN